MKLNKKIKLQRNQLGLSLIELMVAVTIGLLLIIGAGNLYVKGRASYDNNESIARLEETARYAMRVLEDDIRGANYQGLAAVQSFGPNNISGASPSVDANQTLPSPTAPAVNAIANGAAVNACGTNFAVDFQHYVQGDNNGWLPDDQGGGAGFLSASNTAACAPFNNNPVVTADTLTIRGISNTCNAGATLKLVSQVGYGSILISGGACVNTQAMQTNDVLVHAYYVDNDSTQQNGLPSLRRYVLGVGPAFIPEEVIPGVEDMQVQFGIEVPIAGSNPQYSGVANRYVNPNDPILHYDPALNPVVARVVAVRVWLLVRGESPETGFVDQKTYVYGDRALPNTTGDLNVAADAGLAYQPSKSTVAAFAANPKNYRRLLISKTFQIRNSQNSKGYDL